MNSHYHNLQFILKSLFPFFSLEKIKKVINLNELHEKTPDVQREIKVCRTSLIFANSAITLKCKGKYFFDEVEKPILFLPV